MYRPMLLLLCAITFFLAGCSTTQRRLSAKEYYTRATKAFAKEDFATATDQYRELLDQYPLNPYAEEAQLKIAYAYYLDKKYTEAIAAFGDFERSHPTSSHLPFVEYFRGMCYLEQMRSIDRDQSTTEKANDFFRSVTDRYHDSPFAPLAEEKIKICREALAAHELYIADFYQDTHPYAAIVRLRTILENYPETEVTTTALARLNTILTKGNEKELAALVAKTLEARQLTPEEVDDTDDEPTVAAILTDGRSRPDSALLLQLIAKIKEREEQARRRDAAAAATTTPKVKESETMFQEQEEEE